MERTTTPAEAAPGADVASALARIEAALAALAAEQAEQRERLVRLQDHSNLVGHLVQRMGARRGVLRRLRPPPPPLPLRRAAMLVTSPREARAELSRMEAHARATSRSLARRPDGEWASRLDLPAYGAKLAAGLGHLLLGRRTVRYRVRPRRPPIAGPRPRVLHVIPNVFVGGSTQLVVDLHERLGHRYDMQVLTAAKPPGGRHEGMVLHELPTGTPAESFAALLRDVRPALVHLHYWGDVDRPWYEEALAAAADAGAAVVENVNTPVAPLEHPAIRRYVFVSDYVRRSFAPGLADVEVVHPGIDLDLFKPPEAWDPDADDSLGMIYRLHTDKLDASAIEPLILVAKERPRTRVFVIGDGILFEPFRRRVREAGVERSFAFTGEAPYADLPGLLRRFRTFVAPVARESFGQVVPFAMASGHAVAGFRVGALPEILGGDDTLASDAPSLAATLLGLLADPDRLRSLGERNAARAAMFSVDAMIAKYRRIYAETLGEELDLMPGFPAAELFAEV